MKTPAPGPAPTLRQTLQYQPVELEFGTSGLRGLVKDITDLEAYVATRAFLQFLVEDGDAKPGTEVFTAGDLRPSTADIMVPVCRGAADAGFSPVFLGRIPSPALLWYAMKRGKPSVMVTGSHIPFDRNGIKLNRSHGEVRKADEGPIRAAQKSLRETEYGRPAAQSMFDPHGALRAHFRNDRVREAADAASEYLKRYGEAFPGGALAGRKILVFQHSAVGRDLLVQALEALGARAIPAGRSDTFVAVDTEAINPEMLAQVQDLVDANGGSALDAVVSTDGDSDRPLVLGVAEGKVRFFPGDILGIVTADYVGARDIAVPISVNDAVDAHFAARGITPVKTRIGSPYVIQAMRQVGWEANGGFLTATPVSIPGGGTLQALPTRDAFLPILSALCASLGKGLSLPELFSRLPPRFGKSGLLRDFPRDRADAIVKRFSPADTSVMEARWNPAGTSLSIRRTDGTRENAGEADPVFQVLGELRERVSRFFGHERHFSSIAWMSWLDGVRIGFDNGDIAHVRPSGNAPELRVYANSGSSQRADEIVTLATEPGGILQQLAAIQGFRLSPRILALRCPVQHYAWGGYSFIPSLLGEQDSGHAPWAELWIGAHPLAPSEAILDGCRVRLDRLIQEVPEEILGAGDAGRFSARLPFLMKVLDARAMLSIQAHPTKEQAAEGFARENRAGVPLDAPGRLYRDDNHKPEAHVALTEFWMLHGFRPLEEISALLGSVPELGKAMPGFPARLVAAGADRSARENLLRELYTGVMTMPQARVDQVLAPLLDRLSAQERGGALAKDAPDFWALRASREMPLPGGQIDRGIFSIYLLNLLHLHPGEGTYQPAGTLHAYLEGTNVEVMANSDNVLRGGLTPKSVDTGELLKILSYVDGRPPVLKGKEEGNGSRVYETPAQEFVLDRLEPAAGASLHGMRDRGAECLIALEGSALLVSGGTELKLGKGAVALAPAGVPYEMRFPAPGTLVFRARVP